MPAQPLQHLLDMLAQALLLRLKKAKHQALLPLQQLSQLDILAQLLLLQVVMPAQGLPPQHIWVMLQVPRPPQ